MYGCASVSDRSVHRQSGHCRGGQNRTAIDQHRLYPICCIGHLLRCIGGIRQGRTITGNIYVQILDNHSTRRIFAVQNNWTDRRMARLLDSRAPNRRRVRNNLQKIHRNKTSITKKALPRPTTAESFLLVKYNSLT